MVLKQSEGVMDGKVAGIFTWFTIATSGGVTAAGIKFQSIETFIGSVVMIATFVSMLYFNLRRAKAVETTQEMQREQLERDHTKRERSND